MQAEPSHAPNVMQQPLAERPQLPPAQQRSRSAEGFVIAEQRPRPHPEADHTEMPGRERKCQKSLSSDTGNSHAAGINPPC